MTHPLDALPHDPDCDGFYVGTEGMLSMTGKTCSCTRADLMETWDMREGIREYATEQFERAESAEKRIAELEAAIKLDISDAQANCGIGSAYRPNIERCKSYTDRGKRCPDCPLDWTTNSAAALKEGGDG